MMDNEKLYLLCTEGFEGGRIFGLFSDTRELKESYELLKNDYFVKPDEPGGKGTEEMVIYDMKLNEFAAEPSGEMDDEYFSYLEVLDRVAIKDIMQNE